MIKLKEFFQHTLEATRNFYDPDDPEGDYDHDDTGKRLTLTKPSPNGQVPLAPNEFTPLPFKRKYPDIYKSWPGGAYSDSSYFRDDGDGKFSSFGAFKANYDPSTRKWTEDKPEPEWTTF